MSTLDLDVTKPYNLVEATGGTSGGALINYLIDVDGNIDFPVLGKVELVGLSVEQAKDLLNPSTVKVIETDFTSMTIRQLRTYIKDNQIHNKIRQSIGKTVSNASKLELITALN